MLSYIYLCLHEYLGHTKTFSFTLTVNAGGYNNSTKEKCLSYRNSVIDLGNEFSLVTFTIQNIQAHELMGGLWMIYEHYLCSCDSCTCWWSRITQNYFPVLGIGWGGQ